MATSSSNGPVQQWNAWYDGLPQEWRFQVVLWPIIAVAALNMLLTFAVDFPFGLLLLIAIFCLAAIRVPYALDRTGPDGTAPSVGGRGSYRFDLANADRLIELNRQYDEMPEFRQTWLFLAIILTVGAVNMLLTITLDFPFGLLLLLAILALVAIRAPYVSGMLKPSPSAGGLHSGVPHRPEIERAPSSVMASRPAVLGTVASDAASSPPVGEASDQGSQAARE